MYGCAGVVEQSGRLLDGSYTDEQTRVRYRNEYGFEIRRVRSKTGVESLIISAEAYPTVQIRGSVPDAEGLFSVQSISILCSSVFGWNECTIDSSGTGILLENNVAYLHIMEPLETLKISGGKILHNTNRITGENALNQLRARFERIEALVEWMYAQPEHPDFNSQAAFEAFWKPVLLPETYPEEKRPSAYRRMRTTWNHAEDLKWNTRYTESIFPEELWTFRNSGALLRDWEEASGWIYLRYRWEDMIGFFSQEQTLLKEYPALK
ncbi:hypothetical protein FACS1894172_03860 [Spirochaetia bacterium]|nr:hypothetical protein FACS1894172_03860 [Spirochaetia bacterium]